jgi:hypothetical protein
MDSVGGISNKYEAYEPVTLTTQAHPAGASTIRMCWPRLDSDVTD